ALVIAGLNVDQSVAPSAIFSGLGRLKKKHNDEADRAMRRGIVIMITPRGVLGGGGGGEGGGGGGGGRGGGVEGGGGEVGQGGGGGGGVGRVLSTLAASTSTKGDDYGTRPRIELRYVRSHCLRPWHSWRQANCPRNAHERRNHP